jgi:hypothetical protein
MDVTETKKIIKSMINDFDLMQDIPDLFKVNYEYEEYYGMLKYSVECDIHDIYFSKKRIGDYRLGNTFANINKVLNHYGLINKSNYAYISDLYFKSEDKWNKVWNKVIKPKARKKHSLIHSIVVEKPNPYRSDFVFPKITIRFRNLARHSDRVNITRDVTDMFYDEFGLNRDIRIRF